MGRRRKYRKKAKLQPEKEAVKPEAEASKKKARFDEGIGDSSGLGTYTGGKEECIIKQPAIITSTNADENTEDDFMLRTVETGTTCEQNIVSIQAQGVQHGTENELNHTAKYQDESPVQPTAEDKEESMGAESVYTIRNYRASPEGLITEKKHEPQSAEVQREENYGEMKPDCQQLIQNVSNDITDCYKISNGFGGDHEQMKVEVQSFKQEVEVSQEVKISTTAKYHAIVSKVTKENKDGHSSHDFEIMLRNFDQQGQGCQVSDADDFIAKYHATCEKQERMSGEKLSLKLEVELLGFGKQAYASNEFKENESLNTVDYHESSIIKVEKESDEEQKPQISELQAQLTQKEFFGSGEQVQHFLEVNENMSESRTQPVENHALEVTTDDVTSMNANNNLTPDL